MLLVLLTILHIFVKNCQLVCSDDGLRNTFNRGCEYHINPGDLGLTCNFSQKSGQTLGLGQPSWQPFWILFSLDICHLDFVIMSDISSQTSDKDKEKTVRKSCTKCCRSVLFSNDGHDMCIDCLGPHHDMISCSICQNLSLNDKTLRARRLSHWQHEQSGICPSMSVVKALAKTKPIPPHLELEHVNRFFNPSPDSGSDHEEEERGDVEIENDDCPMTNFDNKPGPCSCK